MRPDHQSRDENCEDDENDHAVEAGANASENNFTEHDVDERHHSTERRE